MISRPEDRRFDLPVGSDCVADGNGQSEPKPKKRARSSEAEVEQRVRLAVGMIARGVLVHEIVQAFEQRYRIKKRQAENYIAKARKLLSESLGDDCRALSIQMSSVLMRIIQSTETSNKDKISAIRELNKMLGLYAPEKFAQTDSKGNDLSLDERRNRLRQELVRLRGGDGESFRNGE